MTKKTELLQSSGEYFHAFNRGVNRERIFFEPEDYRLFLRLVPVALTEGGIVILSYCLMPNHFHFELLQTVAYAMARFFMKLCGLYATAVNTKYQRVGHLFQGDYTPKRVTKTESLPWLSRYIDRNPVEAGLVANPADWEYSSASELCGLRKSTFLDSSVILGLVGGEAAYRSFILSAQNDSGIDLNDCMFRE
jgi:putative transposase